jgi:hypothetical protein
MDIIKVGSLGVISTSKEFSIVINEEIIGPLPKTYTMLTLLQRIFREPNNEEVLRAANNELMTYKANKAWENQMKDMLKRTVK